MNRTCATCYHVTTNPKPPVCKICQNGSHWVDRDRPTNVPPTEPAKTMQQAIKVLADAAKPTVAPTFELDDIVTYIGDNPKLKGKTAMIWEITPNGIDIHFVGGEHCWVLPDSLVLKARTNLVTKPLEFTEPDQISHPSHYTQGAVECIDAIRSALTAEEFRGYCKGNIIKYAFRERLKGGDNDVRKAAWYAAKLLEVSDAK